MIRAEFTESNGVMTGFSISGHAGSRASNVNSVVCAAVSSAVQLTVNNITEILGIGGDEDFRENLISFSLTSQSDTASVMIAGLHFHLKCLSEDYPNTIKITISEV
ncbi:MAG: ribosomal-processing cysteine protease Prp [Ruminococcus sp.]